MAIVTLTTDLGTKDHYSAALKGAILNVCQDAMIVDITHQISLFNVLEAAFVVKSSFDGFPEGSIHLVSVDPQSAQERETVVMEYKGHYFVGPNNGVMSLIREKEECEVIRVDRDDLPGMRKGNSFRARNAHAPVAGFLAAGGTMEELGEPFAMRESLWGEPSFSENSMRGIIIHIDHFGNAITNIRKEEFMRLKGDRSFQVFIRNLRMQRIVTTYSDVAKGEALAIFADNSHLEIAIREGSAAQLLGLKEQDMLTIEFYG